MLMLADDYVRVSPVIDFDDWSAAERLRIVILAISYSHVGNLNDLLKCNLLYGPVMVLLYNPSLGYT